MAARYASQESTTIHRAPPDANIASRWLTFLRSAPDACAYHGPQFFSEPFWSGREPFALLGWRDGSVIGVVTGVSKGQAVVSGAAFRPQFLVAPGDGEAEAILLDGLREHFQDRTTVTVFCWGSLSCEMPVGYRAEMAGACVILDLESGSDNLLRQMDHNRRRNIRRAISIGVVVDETSSESDLAEYFAVYQRWHSTPRKAITTQAKDWGAFQEMFRQRHLRRLFVARFEGRIIAGISLRFCDHGMVEFASNSATDEFLFTKPNDLLQWHAIQWACRNGFRRYSLGSAEDFQRRFGGPVVPVVRYRLDNTLFRRHHLRDAISALIGRRVAAVKTSIKRRAAAKR